MSLTEHERAERLEQAAALVAEVLQSLDLEQDDCAACGATRYHNWAHRRSSDVLDGIVRKLSRIVGALRSGEEADHEHT